MTDMCTYVINMHVCKSTNSLKYKRRRKRRRRIAPTREIRRDKQRRIRRDKKRRIRRN